MTRLILVDTVIMGVGLAVAVGLALAGASEYAIIAVAAIFSGIAGVYVYRWMKRQEAGEGTTSPD